MKILQNVCYTNNDGRSTFKLMVNLIQSKKSLNYVMKNNKSGSDFEDDMRVNYDHQLSVSGQFSYRMCSLIEVLNGNTPKKTWED